MRSFDALRSAALATLLACVSAASAAGAGRGAAPLDAGAADACADHGVDALLLQIRGERDALDRRERLVQERERTDAAARSETTRRLAELEALRLRVEERVAGLEAARDERVTRLAGIYGRMPAERAAAVLDALDPDLAAQIVLRMPRTRGAGALSALPSARAAELSRRMVNLRDRTAAPAPLAQAATKRKAEGSGAASVP